MQGLIAATFTPLHPDGRLAADRIPAYAEWLAREQVDGVFVNGTTG